MSNRLSTDKLSLSMPKTDIQAFLPLPITLVLPPPLPTGQSKTDIRAFVPTNSIPV